jgi:ribosomal protein S18 acetylase RimI-like enzyme
MSEQDRTEVRPIKLEDIDAILSIDKEIRARGSAHTYRNLTMEYVLFAERGIPDQRSPGSDVRSLTGDVAPLLGFTLVAEVNGHVCGFILGQVARLRESASEMGIIQMIGVHPDYQRRGIASQLLRALADKYKSEGIKVMRVGLDHRDKNLLGLVERFGFSVDRLIVYSMTL